MGTRRNIEWTERLPDQGKREIRVSFSGNTVKWQFRHPGMEEWDYDTPPTTDQWNTLESKVSALARRRPAMAAQLDHIRRAREKAGR